MNGQNISPRQLRVFLCHSSGDKPKVRDLYRRLQQDGFAPWLDEEDLVPGQDFFAQGVDRSDSADREDPWLRANGGQGLLEKKKVVVIRSRGGAYEKGTAMEAFDFQEPYLRHILGFIGLTDVTFIHAENQAREEAAVFLAAVAERIGGIVIDQNQQVVAR
jgi:hypothetical protein